MHTKVIFELTDFDVTEFMMPGGGAGAGAGAGTAGQGSKASKAGSSPARVLYDLQGVVSHKGSLNTGHYIAYVSTLSAPDEDGARVQQWVRCDDEHVTVVTPAEVLAAEAYILFYVRK